MAGPAPTMTPIDMSGQSSEARLSRLRAEGTVTGTGRPLPRVANPIAGRGPRFFDTVVEQREDRL